MPEQAGHVELVPLRDGLRHDLETWSACACPLAALVPLDNDAGSGSVDRVNGGSDCGDRRIVLRLHRCDTAASASASCFAAASRAPASGFACARLAIVCASVIRVREPAHAPAALDVVLCRAVRVCTSAVEQERQRRADEARHDSRRCSVAAGSATGRRR